MNRNTFCIAKGKNRPADKQWLLDKGRTGFVGDLQRLNSWLVFQYQGSDLHDDQVRKINAKIQTQMVVKSEKHLTKIDASLPKSKSICDSRTLKELSREEGVGGGVVEDSGGCRGTEFKSLIVLPLRSINVEFQPTPQRVYILT